MYVSLPLPPSQDVSRLELTLQTSKQGGIRPREVLLILSVNKSIFLKLQAPGIPLQLAYVSVLPPTAASGTGSGKPLLSTSVDQGPLLLFSILTLYSPGPFLVNPMGPCQREDKGQQNLGKRTQTRRWESNPGGDVCACVRAQSLSRVQLFATP